MVTTSRSLLCHGSLPILVHNVPAAGIRSRVESSIAMTLDLVTINNDTSECERVGNYEWLALPEGTACKRMDLKQITSELLVTSLQNRLQQSSLLLNACASFSL